MNLRPHIQAPTPIRRPSVGAWLALLATAALAWAGDTPAPPPAAAALPDKESQTPVRILQVCPGQAIRRHYPGAVPSLLQHVGEATTLRVEPEPVVVDSFADRRLFEFPFAYVNMADREDWTLTEEERRNLKDYLERGGFLFVDAGITAEFLRENAELGQHHSFAEWDACPELKQALATVFPDLAFQPLSRSHELFRAFYEGLPDSSLLPDTVREYVEREKWPNGTYSAVALRVKGRIAVLATPIIAMGWGRTQLGSWVTSIRFRVLESADRLSENLRTAAYSGARFEVTREDNGKDVVYCQEQALPAWVQEPGDRWRVYRYYGSREISDFAHLFYTRLGTNILVYALTH